jgi:hypothetical protein
MTNKLRRRLERRGADRGDMQPAFAGDVLLPTALALAEAPLRLLAGRSGHGNTSIELPDVFVPLPAAMQFAGTRLPRARRFV